MYDRVIWPEPFHSRVSAIYGLNDIDVETPADTVWKPLIDAGNWCRYFTPENQVRILGGKRELALARAAEESHRVLAHRSSDSNEGQQS